MTRWITYKEASKLFSVSIRTLQRLVKLKKIKAGPGEKLGKKGVRLELKSLYEYFESNTPKRRKRRW